MLKSGSAAARALISPSLGLGDQTKDQTEDEVNERKKKLMKVAGVAGFAPVGAANSLLGLTGGIGIGGSGY